MLESLWPICKNPIPFVSFFFFFYFFLLIFVLGIDHGRAFDPNRNIKGFKKVLEIEVSRFFSIFCVVLLFLPPLPPFSYIFQIIRRLSIKLVLETKIQPKLKIVRFVLWSCSFDSSISTNGFLLGGQKN